MNSTIDGVDPSPFTDNNTWKPQRGDIYIFVVGFICIVVLLTSLSYTSYICRRWSGSPQPTISFGNEDPIDDHHLITVSRGLDDHVLANFPTFLYSDAKTPQECDTANESSCSICLVDYKPTDVVRLLPECSHLFHVTCIDPWLKAHPNCPVCRNSQLAGMAPHSVQQTG